MRLEHKVAIVTGAGGGIGEGIVRRFAREGASVVVADIDRAASRRVAEAIGAEGGRAIVSQTDVTDDRALDDLVTRTLDAFGTVHILVNNAGILRFTPLDTLTRTLWDQVLAVNLTAPVFLSQRVLPHLRAAGGGSIVNISSIQAVLTGPTFAAYAASKGGVLALTRSMALELGPLGIRVNAVLPGYIRTPLFLADAERLGGGDPERFVAELEPRIALRRVGTPEDVAGAVLFAVSDDAAYLNGAAITVDAGVTVQL
jgi:NAD(P)-dependent dehydrogenase (short-subunit alcohol dehydrogenase family)